MRISDKTHAFLAFSLDLLCYKWPVTLANIGCNAVIFSHQVGVTFCVRQVLNGLEAIPAGQALAGLWPYLIGILAVSLIRVAAIMGCSVLDAVRAYYYQNRTRLNVVKHLLNKRDVTQVSGNANRIFETLDDDSPACTFPAELLSEVTGYVIYTLVALGILFSIHWMLTLFIFIPLSVAIYGVQRLSEHMKERRKLNRDAHDEASVFISDVADAALAIKASGATEAVLDRYDAVNAKRRAAVLRDVVFGARVSMLLEGAVCVGVAIMMFMAARLMAGNAFGIGDFSIFIAHLGTLADCVNRIVELVFESRKAEVSYERITGYLDGEGREALCAQAGISLYETATPEVPSYVHWKPCTLQVDGLCFLYTGEEGFRDISFCVNPGELIAVAGGMASGKSTLLNVLMGLMPPQSGSVTLTGVPYPELSGAQTPPQIAGAPQNSGFFAADIQTNIRLGQSIPQEAIDAALHIAALNETVDAMRGGEGTFIGGRGGRLSGGQRQRLALARLLARTAPVSIIDDCVSALDEKTRAEVLHRLFAYTKRTGNAVLIATNAQGFLKAADRVLFMEKGSIVAAGTYSELETASPRFAAVVSRD